MLCTTFGKIETSDSREEVKDVKRFQTDGQKDDGQQVLKIKLT